MFATRHISAQEPRGPGDDFWYAPVGNASVAGARVNASSALQLSAVYKCVRAKAETGAMLPLHIYRRLPRGKARDAGHWLARLLQQPNPWQTGMQWREMMLGHAELRGNGYSHIGWNPRTGIPEQLTPLHPDRIKVEVLEGGLPRYRYTDERGTEQTYVFGEVFHLQGFAVDGYEGINPITAHREAIGAGIVARDYGARYFANSARPPTWIEAGPKPFKDDIARRQWVQDFKAAYGGKNAGTTPVFENGMKLHALAVSNKDAEWLGALNASAIDIAGLFRVPPHKIGILEDAKWANIEHQQIDWVTDGVLPTCVRFEQTIARDLLLFDEEFFAEHVIAMLMRGDTRSRFEAYGKGIQDGWLLRNEAREMENMNPIDGLDTPLEPMNMQPAGSKRAAQERGDPLDDKRAAAAAAPPALDARTLAIQTAAAERIARKEVSALQRATRSADIPLAIDIAFGEQHARFIGEVLVIDAERAAADSQAAAEFAKQLHAAGQLGAWTAQEWEAARVAQLLKLGAEPDKPVTAREMLGLVRAVAQRNVNVGGPVVNLPEQAAPIVNVGGPVVNLPEQAAPIVNVGGPVVNLPEQAAPIINVAAPTINVEAKAAAPEGVMQMEILAMPDRLTTSTIDRDRQGQIVKSNQIEKDA